MFLLNSEKVRSVVEINAVASRLLSPFVVSFLAVATFHFYVSYFCTHLFFIWNEGGESRCNAWKGKGRRRDGNRQDKTRTGME